MRAAIYCRTATVEADTNMKLLAQEKACKAFCKKNKFEVSKVFIDRGQSGANLKRPGLQKLLAYIRGNKDRLHAIVVYDPCRLSRSALDYAQLSSLFSRLGIAIKSTSASDTDSPTERFLESLLFAACQLEKAERSERIKAGLKTAIKRKIKKKRS